MGSLTSLRAAGFLHKFHRRSVRTGLEPVSLDKLQSILFLCHWHGTKGSKHIISTSNRAIRKLNILRRLCGTNWGAKPRILRTTYTTLIRPIMEYATPVWAPSSSSLKVRLDSVQAKAAKIITGAVSSTNNEKIQRECVLDLLARKQKTNKNKLDRHFGNEEPEDEISLTTCGLVDPPFSENEVKLTAFKFGKRKSSGPEGIDNTVVKALQIFVREIAMAAALQKFDIDPEQQLYTPKIVDIAVDVMEMHGVLDRLRFLPIKKMDQRTCIKFCVKNEIKCADAFRMLTVAYGEATLDRSNVYRWYKMFSEGREDVNDEERAGRPSTSSTDEKINEVKKMILANRRITVREVAEDLNISIGSCHSIFINDLGMRRVAAKFVPKLLNCDQKQHRMNIANEMLDSVRDDPNLLQRAITGDEAWVYGYDVEAKAQSSQWKLPHEPRPKKARQVRSNVKVLLTVFFDYRGVVHHEFLPQGRTVNKEYYLQVMRNLREAIRQKRPDLWKNKNWLLHHDNPCSHIVACARLFGQKQHTNDAAATLFPRLAPCDFFLFPKLKRPMKGRRYATLDEIKTASKEELKKIFFFMIF
ncbi:hypothetical protein LAZ67_16000683 [Cordylochernes scorpioides]|uniref:Mos1 transposase HTH domain-containing protein n=1 Tax=Cordylochernes scorpioides TaxID=51811 RepID=A0ABY6LAR3_9ARAC|nr:hypothetical protein LAZ67_16000683 [Cordylochernes scorpioides]